jgi:hypothetical protein
MTTKMPQHRMPARPTKCTKGRPRDFMTGKGIRIMMMSEMMLYRALTRHKVRAE